MRILNLDTVYPDVLHVALRDQAVSPVVQTQQIMEHEFGCWNSWSTAFFGLGHEAAELITNLPCLSADAALLQAIQPETWDVIVVQNIHDRSPDFWAKLKASGPIMVGHFSHRAPSDEHLKAFDLLITAFPHYAERYAARGFNIKYLPLAFDSRHLTGPHERDIPICFIGGVGREIWAAGTEGIERCAREVPAFQAWGYGEPFSCEPLKGIYRGQAWGKAYFDILQRARIVINRHGEVAAGFASCMRLYEATGCGALLVTETAPNLWELFSSDECVMYGCAEELVWACNAMLLKTAEDTVRETATRGQLHTLREHTYHARAKMVLSWL